MARRRRSIPESGAPSAAEAEIRQLELARNQNDQKLKSRFERIFRKYEHDFTDVGDEIDIESGEIVVDNGHLLNMRDEADPGQSRSASSRFVRTFQEKLGHEEGTEEEDDDEDDGEDEDEEDDSESGGDGDDDQDGTDETDDADGGEAFESLATVEPFRALKRPPPRLAQLLVGGAVAADDQDQSIEDSASDTSTSTPTGLLAQVPALQASMSTLAAKAKRPAVDTDTIQALGLTIANQLAQLMAGASKKRKRKPRPVSRSNTTDPAWHYPEISRDSIPRRKQLRTKSPVRSVRISSPAAPSPEQRSLWAPEGRQKKLNWKEVNAATPARRVLRSSLLTSSVLKKEDVRRCGNCSLTNSTSWQPGPDGEDLCASCAKYYDYYGRMKPFDSPTPSIEDVEERESSVETLSDVRFESARSSPAPPAGEEDDVEMDPPLDDASEEEEAHVEAVHPKSSGAVQLSEPRTSRVVKSLSSSAIRHAAVPAVDQSPTKLPAVPRSIFQVQASSRPEALGEDQRPDELTAARVQDPPQAELMLRGSARTANDFLPFSHTSGLSPRLHQAHVHQHAPEVEEQEVVMIRAQPRPTAIERSPLTMQHTNENVPSTSNLQIPQQSIISRTQQSSRPRAVHPPRHIAPLPVPTVAPPPPPPPPAAGYGILVPVSVAAHDARLSRVSSVTSPAVAQPAVVTLAASDTPGKSPKKKKQNFDVFVNESPATLYTANTSRVIADADPSGTTPVPYKVEEDATIIRLKEYDKFSWPEIAKRLPGRTVFSVQRHYCRLLHGKSGPGRELAEAQYAADHEPPPDPPAPHDAAWDNEQDELLLELREDRELDWDEIADIMTNHTEAALESRYYAIVEPSAGLTVDVPAAQPESRNFVPWTAEEDALIVRLREVDHVRWSDVAQYFDGRAPHSIQKRYSRFLVPDKRKLPPVYPYELTLEERIFQVDPELATLINPTKRGEHITTLNRPFGTDEDELILQLRAQKLSWKAIAPQLRDRTAEALQIRHAELLAGRATKPPPSRMPSVRRTDTPPFIQHRATGNDGGPSDSRLPTAADFHNTTTSAIATGEASPHVTPRANNESAHGPAPAEAAGRTKLKRGPGMRHPFTEAEDDLILHLRETQGYRWEEVAARLPGRSVKSISTRYDEHLRPVRGGPSIAESSGRSLPLARQTTRKTRQSLPSAIMAGSRAQSGLLRHALRNSRRRSDLANDQSAAFGHDIDNPISLDDDEEDTAAISQQLNEELRSSVSRPLSLGPAWTSNSRDIQPTTTRNAADDEPLLESAGTDDAPRATASSAALQEFLSRAPQQPSLVRDAQTSGRTQQSPIQVLRNASVSPSEDDHEGSQYGTPTRMNSATQPYYMAPPVFYRTPAGHSERQITPVAHEDSAWESMAWSSHTANGTTAVQDHSTAEQSQQDYEFRVNSSGGEVFNENPHATLGEASGYKAPAPGSRGSASEESLVMPEKPKFSNRQLVHMAFQAVQSETMFPREVCRWIQNNFEYYRAVPDVWKAAVRAELNGKRHFEPVQTARGREFRVRSNLEPEVAKRPQEDVAARTQRGDELTKSRNKPEPVETYQTQETDQAPSHDADTRSAQVSWSDSISTDNRAPIPPMAPYVVPTATMQRGVEDSDTLVMMNDEIDDNTLVQPRRGRPRGSKTMRKYNDDGDDEDYTPASTKRISSSNVATRGRLRQSTGSLRENGEDAAALQPDEAIEIADSDDEDSQRLSSPAPPARSSEKRVHFMETVEVRRPATSGSERPHSRADTSDVDPQHYAPEPQDGTAESVLPRPESDPVAMPRSSSPTFIKPSTPAIVFKRPKARVSDGAAYTARPAASGLRVSQLRQYETPRRASTGMPVSTPQRAGTPTAIFAYRASPAASGVGDRFGFGRRVVETPIRELADPNEDELA